MSTRSASSRLSRIAPTALFGLLWCTLAGAQPSIAFHVDSPAGIAPGPDGAMWFTSYQLQKIGRIDAFGIVDEFPTPNSSPFSIVAGPDGNLWYTVLSGRIGRMTTSGAVAEFALPDPFSQPREIAAGPDGNLWFTEALARRVGRITTAGVVTEFPVSGALADITAGPDGNMWFTEAETRKIGRITPAGAVTEFVLPDSSREPLGIAAGADGNLWYSQTDVGFGEDGIGRITPGGVVSDFPAGNIVAGYGIVAGTDGNLWVGGHNGALGRMTTSGALTEFAPFGAVGGTSVLAAAADGSIWLTNYETDQVVRFAADALPCIATASSLCLGNGRFRVTADWKAGDGSTGHGHGVGLTPNSGYFWFFEAANVEMIVKVLDGCEANQHDWVFAAGLTNVEVTTTVTDIFSGLSKTYTNTQGTPFAPVQDTTAFAGCP